MSDSEDLSCLSWMWDPQPKLPVWLTRMLSLIDKQEEGDIPFSSCVINPAGIMFSQLHWLTKVDKYRIPDSDLTFHGSLYFVMGLHINLEKHYLGVLEPGAGHCIAVSRHSDIKQCLLNLIEASKSLSFCLGCHRIYGPRDLAEGYCGGCCIRDALGASPEVCTICQEETCHYLITECHHKFHPMCLIEAKRGWLRNQPDIQMGVENFPCPNCRAELPCYAN